MRLKPLFQHTVFEHFKYMGNTCIINIYIIHALYACRLHGCIQCITKSTSVLITHVLFFSVTPLSQQLAHIKIDWNSHVDVCDHALEIFFNILFLVYVKIHLWLGTCRYFVTVCVYTVGLCGLFWAREHCVACSSIFGHYTCRAERLADKLKLLFTPKYTLHLSQQWQFISFYKWQVMCDHI